MSAYAQDRHKRVARMVGYALTLAEPDTWGHTSFVMSARLTVSERASLAFSALRALEPADRELVMGAAHWGQLRGLSDG